MHSRELLRQKMSKTAPISQMEGSRIADLTSNPLKDQQKYLAEIQRIEKKNFPSSEALDFDAELKKRNTNVILALKDFDGSIEVAAYLVYLRMKRLTLLHKICVAQPYRQQGIAKEMITLLRSRLEKEGCDSVQLWVDEGRTAARALYASCDFKQIDRCPDYYGPGRTGLRMVLRLE